MASLCSQALVIGGAHKKREAVQENEFQEEYSIHIINKSRDELPQPFLLALLYLRARRANRD